MGQFQKWMSVGLLTLTPGLAFAGSPDAPILKAHQGAATAAARSAKKTNAAANQELADKIAKTLRGSKLDGYDISIDVRDGVVVLEGFVLRAEQRTAAAKAARAVPGVTAVNNRLRVGEPDSRRRIDQSAAEPARPAGLPLVAQPANYAAANYPVRQANYEAGYDRPAAIQQAVAYEAGPVGTTAPVTYVSTGMTPYSPQTPAAGYAMYQQPNCPANAGPMYAQNQSSAGAWPYNGPFQPYPQCPLGWRKVSMYWDEGLWKIDFGQRKPRWQ